MSRKELDNEWLALKARKDEQHRRDDYLLDDPGGRLKVESNKEWLAIKDKEISLLRRELELLDERKNAKASKAKS